MDVSSREYFNGENMKNLLKLELKKVLKKRQTKILFVISLFFSVLLAYIPLTFQRDTIVMDSEGRKIIFKGIDSIKQQNFLQKNLFGDVTSKNLRFAVEEIQRCLLENGVKSQYNLTNEIYSERIQPYTMLARMVQQVFVDTKTGFMPSVLQLSSEDINDSFYIYCGTELERVLKQEHNKFPKIQYKAISMYENVKKPFTFYGSNGDAIEYQSFLSLIVLIVCIVLAAPIFSLDYQTGAEDILRCTKYGGLRLGIIKISTTIIISSVLYLLCMTIYLSISNTIFGWDFVKTSLQVIIFPGCLIDWNIGQLQFAIVITGLLSTLTTVNFTLFISSKFSNVIVPLGIGLITCILPIISYMFTKNFPLEISIWCQALLPSSGAGIVNNLYYAVADLMFLRIGELGVWLPYAMITFSAIELVVFMVLTINSYNSYKIN